MTLLLAGWAATEGLLRTAQSRVNERLASRGLILKSSRDHWSLLGGITLDDAVLCKKQEGEPPILEISTIHVDVEWAATLATRSAVTRWTSKAAQLTLHDDEGAVTLTDVTTALHVQRGQIFIQSLTAKRDGLDLQLEGEVLTSQETRTSSQPLDPKLKPVRTALNVMAVEKGTGPLRLNGKLHMDLREQPARWSLDTEATGADVVWRELPLRSAALSGRAWDGGLDLQGDFGLKTGSIEMSLRKEGWAPSPISMEGKLADNQDRTSDFKATFEGTETGRKLSIPELRGTANLLTLAESVPALADHIPSNVKLVEVPETQVRGFVWNMGAEPSAWALEELRLLTPSALDVEVRGQPLRVKRLLGTVSKDKAGWHLKDLRGGLLDGEFQLQARYDGHILEDANVRLKSLRLKGLQPWLGDVKESLENSDLSLTYKGSICREPVRSTGSGSLVLTNAPVVHVPLLEQTYALFPKVLPDKGRRGAGQFQVTFAMTKGVATIDPFKGRSEAVTVTARGTVDLVKRYVKGYARANLRGIVGRITLPLSHILTDMNVEGPLDDIRVTPDGAVGAAREWVKGGSRLSGRVLTEAVTVPFEALGVFGQ